jgi:uridine kinase
MSSLPTDYCSEEYIHTRKLLKQQQEKSLAPSKDDSVSLSAAGSNLQRLAALKITYAQQQQPNKPEPFIIGVCGGSASGKTTVCAQIVKALANKRVVVISQDSFYRPLTKEEKELANKSDYNFDHPDAFDYELLEKTMKDLKQGKNVKIPVYDFKTHSRLDKEVEYVFGADVIILEGILLFNSKELREMMDMKIYVDTDADTRLVRRIRRDILERGRDLESILAQYERFVKPSYDDYISPTKKYADIIIPRGGANTVAIDLLVQHIKSKLAERGTPV